jgi:hypothetical protein
MNNILTREKKEPTSLRCGGRLLTNNTTSKQKKKKEHSSNRSGQDMERKGGNRERESKY